jgi:nitrogen-specific signal transduction histidine kinase/ActR/RegA family two-component response regulator
LIGISRDITRQRELEQQLLQSQKMEAMGKLAGGVAHDFNNLLVVIQGYGELLHDELSPEDERRDHIVQQLKAVGRAASLTKQLLSFSRNGPSRTTLVDVNETVSDLVQMLRRLIPENVDLILDLTSNRISVQADATRLEQVVINLVINARDAMPQGGQIVLKTESTPLTAKSPAGSPPSVRISVKDTGSGISPEIRDRIFEPFFSTKELGKGTGLGLSTVYGIVRQLGGDIFVESEVGKGTCFSVDIPSSTGTHSSAPTSRAKPRTSQGSETILLVEDDDDVREITRRILEDKSYTVLQASLPSQAQAVSASFQGTIDLILTDVSMPEMDGLSLVESLIQERPEMQVLYMSGYVEIEATEARLIQNNESYLEKPFGPERLLNAIREVFEAK